MYRPNEQQRAGYIAASERCIGTAVGLPIPATAQNLIGTEPIRRGAAETNSGYAPQKSCSWLIRAAARRGRAAVSAAPEKPLLRSGCGFPCIVPQPKQGFGATACPGRRVQADAGDSAFPHRRFRAQALSVCGRWMRLPACGIAPLRERRACACLCIAAAFFALGFCAAYEEQRFCAADFLRTMRRRSERGLSAAYASRRRHGVHRPFFRRRAKLDRPPLFERANRRAVWYPSQTSWPHIPRRAAAARPRAAVQKAERAAAEERGNVSSPADSSLLRSASKAARASRPPPRKPPCAAALPNAAIPYGKSCIFADSHKNNPNKPKRRGDFRRKAGKRPYSPKTAAARRIRMQGIQRYAAKKSNAAGRRCRR